MDYSFKWHSPVVYSISFKTFQKIMDPASLSEMLTNMREILLAKQTNYVNDLTAYWSMGFSRLRGLLDNPRLIWDKLGIRVIGEDQILMALGAKLNVPVPRNIFCISLTWLKEWRQSCCA